LILGECSQGHGQAQPGLGGHLLQPGDEVRHRGGVECLDEAGVDVERSYDDVARQ
jgi:hypothetical protein